MSSLMCLVCGKLSDQSRCPLHREPRRKGHYDWQHIKMRLYAIQNHPFCAKCNHQVNAAGPRLGACNDLLCRKCPLEFHHVEALQGGRAQSDSRRQLLCKLCHRKETNGQ